MRVAMVLYDKAHWIFDTDETIEQVRARFEPSFLFLEVDSSITEGMDYVEGVFTIILPELADAKLKKKEQINARRDELERLTLLACGTDLFDFTDDARNRLSEATDGALILALQGYPLTTQVATWTLYDNTTKPMTIQDFFAVKAAIIERSQTLHNRAKELKNELFLESTDTLQKIAAIPIE